jgi:hypothetical protein
VLASATTKEVRRCQWKPAARTNSKCSRVGENHHTVGRSNITASGLTIMVAIHTTGNRISAA